LAYGIKSADAAKKIEVGLLGGVPTRSTM